MQGNQEGILDCWGRIQGHYPIFPPDSSPFTRKLVHRSYVYTLHGGEALTITKVRELYWVPRLRALVKQVLRACSGCKRFQGHGTGKAASWTPTHWPHRGSTPFEVIGVDFAGPIKYRIRAKTEGKAYLALYACSLTRGLFLEVLPNLATSEFLRSLKRLIARRGRPKKIYSDNGKTFVGAEKWLKQVMRDEKTQDYLAHENIKWQWDENGEREREIKLIL